MTRKLIGMMTVLGFGLFLTGAALACPEHEAAEAKANAAATASASEHAKGGCSKPCAHGAGAASASVTVQDGRSEPTEVKSDKPCHGKDAATVSDKAVKPCCANFADCTRCGKSAKSASASSGCPISAKVDAVLASMPAMKYRVGDDVTGCVKEAAAKSDASGKTIEFVVGDSTFKEKGEAMAKLVSLLEGELDGMQSVQYVAGGKCMKCPMTAKSVAAETKSEVAYRVGGVDFVKKEDAEKALAAVTKAVADIHMEYKVGEQKYGCDKMAGEKAKENGGKMTYVVGGEETCCSTMAKLLLAEAKVRKVVETAVQTSFQS